MKKYMTLEELFEFLNQQFELSMVELTNYMETESIEPKTKISNIPRYEQEDSQEIYDYFVSIKSKKKTEKVTLDKQEIKSELPEVSIEKREYTIPEMATLVDENKSKFYRFVGQHKIKPTQVRNKTKYFSYEDTLKIISYFSETDLTIGQTTMNRGVTSKLTSEPSELVSELDNVTDSELPEPASEKTGKTGGERTAMNRGVTGELAGKPSEPVSELGNVTDNELRELKQDSTNKEVEKQQIEITYLVRENELLRSELDQKNRQLAELTQRLEQAQYLHSRTQTITEKQQPFFKKPEIIETEQIEDTEQNELSKRSLLGFLKKNN